MKFRDDEISSRIILENGTVWTKCDICRSMYAERTPPGTTPCETCRVDLMEENREASEIYFLTRGQTLFSGDINHLAIDAAIERNGIRDRKKVFEKVLWVFHELRKDQGGNSE